MLYVVIPVLALVVGNHDSSHCGFQDASDNDWTDGLVDKSAAKLQATQGQTGITLEDGWVIDGIPLTQPERFWGKFDAVWDGTQGVCEAWCEQLIGPNSEKCSFASYEEVNNGASAFCILYSCVPYGYVQKSDATLEGDCPDWNTNIPAQITAHKQWANICQLTPTLTTSTTTSITSTITTSTTTSITSTITTTSTTSITTTTSSTITSTTTTTRTPSTTFTTTTITGTTTTLTLTSSTNTGFVETTTEAVAIVDNALDFAALSNNEKTVLELELLNLVASLPFVGSRSVHHIVLANGGVSAINGESSAFGTTATIILMPTATDTLAIAIANAFSKLYASSSMTIVLGSHTFLVDSNTMFIASSALVLIAPTTTVKPLTTAASSTSSSSEDELTGSAVAIISVCGLIALGLMVAMVNVWLQIPHGDLEFQEMKFLAGHVNPDITRPLSSPGNNNVGFPDWAQPVDTGGIDDLFGGNNLVTFHDSMLPGGSPPVSPEGVGRSYDAVTQL